MSWWWKTREDEKWTPADAIAMVDALDRLSEPKEKV